MCRLQEPCTLLRPIQLASCSKKVLGENMNSHIDVERSESGVNSKKDATEGHISGATKGVFPYKS